VTKDLLWVAVAAGVPLFVLPAAEYPFDPSKASLLQILTGLLLVSGSRVLWCSRGTAAKPQPAPESVLRCRPWQVPLVIAALACIGVMLLSCLVSADWRSSLWGSYAWADGLWTELCYIALFFLLAGSLASQRSELLGKTVALAGTLIAIYGLAQYTGVDLLPWETDSESRVLSTLGRSNYLGAYLALTLPFTLGRAEARKGISRAAWVLGIYIQAVALILTGARAAWLGAAAGLSLWALLKLYPGFGRRKAGVIAVLLVVVAAAMVILGVWGPRLVQRQDVSMRAAIWQASVRLLQQRPLLGHGPGTYEFVVRTVLPGPLQRAYSRGLRIADPHNLVLDAGVNSGLLGVAAWLLLMTCFFVEGQRAYAQDANEKGRLLGRTAIAVGTAYVVTGLLTPVTVSVALTWWLTAGLLASESRSLRQSRGQDMPCQPPEQRRRWLRAVGLIGSGFLLLGIGLSSLLGSVSTASSQSALARGNISQGIQLAKRATRLEPWRWQDWVILGDMNAEAAHTSGGVAPTEQLTRARSSYEKAAGLCPICSEPLLRLAELDMAVGEDGSLDRAGELLRRAHSLDPFNARVLTDLGRAALAEAQPVAALEWLEKSKELDPTDALTYFFLAEAHGLVGHRHRACLMEQRAADLGALVGQRWCSPSTSP